MDIFDIPNTLWRDQLLPATFRGQQFHCESMTRENGTHVVVHEFPKRDLPYAEPMGRRAFEFTIRGYCIAYPFNTNQPLYQRDYRVPRDNLLNVLEAGLPGALQLPTLPPLWVMCTRYRLTEEEKTGGYCSFDMSFVEYGIKPTATSQNTFANTLSASEFLKARVEAVLAQNPNPYVHTAGSIPSPSQVAHAASGRSRSSASRQARVQSVAALYPPGGRAGRPGSRSAWRPDSRRPGAPVR